MSLHDALARAAEAGVPVDDLTVGTEPGMVPPGPSGCWVLIPLVDGSVALGGMDRGGFAPYGRYYDDDATVNALRHVTQSRIDEVPVDEATRAQLSTDAQRLAAELRARAPRGLSTQDIPVGTALDQIGPDSGFSLFLLDTPFAQRSSPPTDLALPRRGWLLREPLPDTVRVAPVVEWFGQPGGGILVTLDRPVRWYYDTRRVDAFAVL